MKKVFTNVMIFSSLFLCSIACGQAKPTTNYKKVDGITPTCVSSGYKDYYYSQTTNSYAEDENGTNVIANIETWKLKAEMDICLSIARLID